MQSAIISYFIIPWVGGSWTVMTHWPISISATDFRRHRHRTCLRRMPSFYRPILRWGIDDSPRLLLYLQSCTSDGSESDGRCTTGYRLQDWQVVTGKSSRRGAERRDDLYHIIKRLCLKLTRSHLSNFSGVNFTDLSYSQ